jgi:hypothetical protein
MYRSKMASVPSPSWAFDWNDEAMNAPEWNSPQPCEHGAGCTYYGSCRFVHPGEEGTGRLLFEERVVTNEDGSTYTQPACVRLIGAAGFYRRRRAQMSWPEFCARNQIPYVPNPRRNEVEDADADVDATPATPAPRPPAAQRGRVHGPRVHSSYRGDGVVQQEQGGSRGALRGGRGQRGRRPANTTQWAGLPQPLSAATQQPV